MTKTVKIAPTVLATVSALVLEASNKKLTREARATALGKAIDTLREVGAEVPAEMVSALEGLESKRADGVCEYVRGLIRNRPDLDWDSIAKMARSKFPGAKTSNKSVASLARDLRKELKDDGYSAAEIEDLIPSRTKKGAPKIDGAVAGLVGLLESDETETEGEDETSE